MTSEPLSSPSAAPASHIDASAQRLSIWFAITGLLLLATVLAAAFVQARQYSLLQLTVRQQDEYLALSLYQVETEYLRLREQLRLELAAPGSAALQLRYDIFVSRVALTQGQRTQRLLAYGDQDDATLQSVSALIARTDLYLGPEARAAISPQAAGILLVELEALDAPIHQLMIEASHLVARHVSDRQTQLRDHNRIGLGLTGFLLAMVLLFAAIAMRQMRSLEQRRGHQARLADELRAARIEAEAANAAKSEFLADMSHELRTPLHGLLGMLSLARESPRDPRAADWLGAADRSAQHLRRLIDDIIDLGKLESGTLALSPAPVALAGLLSEVQALLLPQASAKGLGLHSELDPTLPALVMLDATRTRQVLYNLLVNAIKFSEIGAIVLRCCRRGEAGAPPMLAFEVADTGIGMDHATVARLFRRFGRADDPRARRQDGSGLGLAISRKLARLMGGELSASSTPGAGSLFSLRCPLQPAAVASDGVALALAGTARPLQVLVAEDHPVNQLYMSALLARLGHHAAVVDDGRQALQALQARLADAQLPAFDLVLMDVHMPVMDGVEATAALRQLPPPLGQVCVVALTADVYGETRDRCLAAGMNEVATKPMGSLALRTLLDRHFGSPLATPDRLALPALPVPTTATAHCGRKDQRPGLLDAVTLQSVRELMGPAAVPGLYGGFFKQADDSASRMREALREADTEALRRSAHNVKGAALNLGLPALAQAAARLNSEAGSLAPPQLALALQRYEEIVLATRALCEGEGLLP